MYLLLIISFVFVLVKNVGIYSENYKARLKPQICRAVIQVARIIPQLEESETALREVCDQMNSSWERIAADCVIQPPIQYENYNEYLQYIGVSIRNEEDLCDGFVMIGVDPTIRDDLLNALKLEKVLNNLVIGLPDYAVAAGKEDLTQSLWDNRK